MKLEFYNCPKSEEINLNIIKEVPEFIKYRPDFDLINKIKQEYEKYENILIIGHGGSITSFYGFYNSLKFQTKKNAYFLNTVDPDYIFELKHRLKPENTLVIAISKSGENVTQIEAMSQFTEFPILVITGKASSLRAIAEKLKLPVILHPQIGGRYTGFTEVSLIPSAIVGLDVESLYKGAKSFYDLYEKDNLAWRAASVMYQLEQKGFVDVFMPFYSHYLFAESALIIQLCHESFGKEGKGQSYLAHEAPESQHHTNQRFFGGIKNICGFFISSENFINPLAVQFAPTIHSIQFRGRALFDLNKIPLSKSMECELNATMEDARIQGIPFAHLSINNFNSMEIGNFTAFWQLFAVYSSILRLVNPYNQPQVENSKNISLNKRLQFKGLS